MAESNKIASENGEFKGNELVTSCCYIQTFTVKREENDVTNKINTYIQNVLNDTENTVGIIFYRAKMFRLRNDDDEVYTLSVHFYLMSLQQWTDEARRNLFTTYFEGLQNKMPSLNLISETVQEETNTLVRDPVSFDHAAKEETPGCSNIAGKNCLEKCFNFWLIVPRVQWDFFDLLYQMYTFDIFHQGLAAKYVHFFTIPTNVMLSMMFLAQFNLNGEIRYGNAFAVNVALILLIVLGLSYIIMGFLRNSWEWGMATFVVLCVLNMTGNLWYYSYRTIGNPWYNPTDWYTNPIIWSYIMSIVQASSHMLVPQIPSYISGVKHWESLHMFFNMKRKNTKSTLRHIGFVILSLITFPVLSVSVAWFSWPHLIGTEVIYILAGIGYRPKFFEKYFRVAEKMERSGNPVMDHFPTSHKDVPRAHVEVMERNGILGTNATEGELLKHAATLKLSAIYLRTGLDMGVRQRKKNQNQLAVGENDDNENHKEAIDQLTVMLAARKGLIGKSNNAQRNNTEIGGEAVELEP